MYPRRAPRSAVQRSRMRSNSRSSARGLAASSLLSQKQPWPLHLQRLSISAAEQLVPPRSIARHSLPQRLHSGYLTAQHSIGALCSQPNISSLTTAVPLATAALATASTLACSQLNDSLLMFMFIFMCDSASDDSGSGPRGSPARCMTACSPQRQVGTATIHSSAARLLVAHPP